MTNKKISDTEYGRVLEVWSAFKIKAMKDYHKFYLKCDIFLLADYFGKFRNNSLKNHGCCPSHYLRAPALSWDVVLNITKVDPELVSDAGMYLFLEKGIRVSYISKRYSQANKNQNILFTWVPIIYMVTRCLNFFQISFP